MSTNFDSMANQTTAPMESPSALSRSAPSGNTVGTGNSSEPTNTPEFAKDHEFTSAPESTNTLGYGSPNTLEPLPSTSAGVKEEDLAYQKRTFLPRRERTLGSVLYEPRITAKFTNTPDSTNASGSGRSSSSEPLPSTSAGTEEEDLAPEKKTFLHRRERAIGPVLFAPRH